MLTTKEINKIVSFSDFFKEKGYYSILEYDKNFGFVLYFDFEFDAFEMIEKLVKDWMIFHSEIVNSYTFEICEDGVNCRFNLYVRERFL